MTLIIMTHYRIDRHDLNQADLSSVFTSLFVYLSLSTKFKPSWCPTIVRLRCTIILFCLRCQRLINRKYICTVKRSAVISSHATCVLVLHCVRVSLWDTSGSLTHTHIHTYILTHPSTHILSFSVPGEENV